MGIFGNLKGRRDDETKRLVSEYTARGREYIRVGKYSEGLAELEKAIKLDPNCADAYYSKGFAYQDLARAENQRAGGNIYFSAGQEYLQQAINAFKETTRIQPNAADAHYTLGLAYDNLCQFEEAERCYRNAIRIDPEGIDGADAYFNLSLMMYMKAIGWLGLKQTPGFFMLVGEQYVQRDEAIQIAEKGIEICEKLVLTKPQFMPDLVKHHRRLANWLDRAGKGSEAIIHFQRVWQLAPGDPEVREWLTLAEKNTGRKLI